MTNPIDPTTNQPRSIAPSRGGGGARYVNMLMSAWLFVSAFIWPHTAALRTNTWIVAVLMFIAAIWAVGQRQVRFANTVLAVWLFISSIFMASMSPGTVWNNLVVSVIVFIVSLTPSNGARAPTAGHPAHT